MEHRCYRCGKFVSETNQAKCGGYCASCITKLAEEYGKEEIAGGRVPDLDEGAK